MKHNVYLAQVNNQFGNNVFLPYSVGLIQAYCQTIPQIADNFHFQDLIYLRSDTKAASKQMEDPAVVGISCYIWNWEWSKALAQSVKKHHPGCLVVMGGPQAPLRSQDFFQEHPYVDLLVHHEGEAAFADVLLESLEEAPDYTQLGGLSVKLNGNRCLRTPPRERMQDVDEVPSPYLAGLFDGLIKEPYDFHASQETHRGCPYSCTFCDWGSAVFTKVRAFSDERLTKELVWFGQNQIELLYNCDANYGLLKRDHALTEKLVETKQRFGFPKQFRAAYAKNSDQKIFRLAKMLNDAQMSKGVTLSFQSMDPGTLKSIKRDNIKVDDFQALMTQYRQENIPTYTELIMGLPGETYDSFADGIDRLLGAGQHEGLNIYLCSVLPNSEMADPSYIEEHGIKSVRIPILHQHSSPQSDGITECNDIVVETHQMSRPDFRRIFLFSWAVQSFHCLGLTQYLAVYLHFQFGLSYRSFYEELLDFAGNHPGTLLGHEFQVVSKTLDGAVNGQGFGIVIPRFGEILWPDEEATFLNLVCQKEQFYRELPGFLTHLLAARGWEVAEERLWDLLTYQARMIIDPFSPEVFSFEINSDLQGYFSASYQGASAPLGRVPCLVTVQSDRAYDGDLELYAREVVWYGRKGGGFRHGAVQSRPLADELTEAPV